MSISCLSTVTSCSAINTVVFAIPPFVSYFLTVTCTGKSAFSSLLVPGITVKTVLFPLSVLTIRHSLRPACTCFSKWCPRSTHTKSPLQYLLSLSFFFNVLLLLESYQIKLQFSFIYRKDFEPIFINQAYFLVCITH